MSNRFFQVDAYPGSEIISASVVGALSINGSSGDYAITTQDITNGSNLYAFETYATIADLEVALNDFLTAQGSPWMAVGTPSDYTDSTGWHVIAVNLNIATSVGSSGSGLTFGGIGAEAGASLGYEPFASAADAEAAITQLIGVYTFQTPG